VNPFRRCQHVVSLTVAVIGRARPDYPTKSAPRAARRG